MGYVSKWDEIRVLRSEKTPFGKIELRTDRIGNVWGLYRDGKKVTDFLMAGPGIDRERARLRKYVYDKYVLRW